MPVYLRPDERAALPQQPVEIEEEESTGLFTEVGGALVSSWLWALLGGALLVAGLSALKTTLIAAEKLRHHGGGASWDLMSGPEWLNLWAPVVFFAIFGAVFGAFVAWRISYADKIIWLAVAILGLVLAVVGGVAGAFIFPHGVPTMCLIGLATLVVGAIGGAVFETHWGG
jgi:hypothetical protein